MESPKITQHMGAKPGVATTLLISERVSLTLTPFICLILYSTKCLDTVSHTHLAINLYHKLFISVYRLWRLRPAANLSKVTLLSKELPLGLSGESD